MIDIHTWQFIVTTVLLLGSVAASVAYVMSKIRHMNEDEQAALILTRGHTIKDLETKVDKLASRVDALEAEQRVLYKLKADEIANLVVEKLGSAV